MTELKLKLEYHAPSTEILGGLHADVITVEPCDETLGKRVVVSSGLGYGHLDFYVSVDGKRVLVANSTPFLRALVDAALTEASKK